MESKLAKKETAAPSKGTSGISQKDGCETAVPGFFAGAALGSWRLSEMLRNMDSQNS